MLMSIIKLQVTMEFLLCKQIASLVIVYMRVVLVHVYVTIKSFFFVHNITNEHIQSVNLV